MINEKITAKKVTAMIKAFEPETNDALTRLYFRLLFDKKNPRGLMNQNVLPPSEKDSAKYERNRNKWIKLEKELHKKQAEYDGYSFYKKYKRKIKPRDQITREDLNKLRDKIKKIKIYTKSHTHYNKLLKRFSKEVPFFTVTETKGNSEYYTANPRIIHAFFRRYSLSRSEFEDWVKKEEELRRGLKRYPDRYEGIIGNLRERARAKGEYTRTEDEEGAIAMRQLMIEVEKGGDFESMLKSYIKYIPGIEETELGIPKKITSFARSRRERIQITMRGGTRKSESNEVEWIVADYYWYRKIESMVRPHLFLTFWTFDDYRKTENISKEEENQILNWIFAHIIGWFTSERAVRKINFSDSIDIDWIERVKGHFLKEFPDWKEKLIEITKKGWYDKVLVIREPQNENRIL